MMHNISWIELIPFGQTIGWTVLHSLWQLALIAIFLRIVLLLIPQKQSSLRYNILFSGLIASVIWLAFTFASEWRTHQSISLHDGSTAAIAPLSNAEHVDEHSTAVHASVNLQMENSLAFIPLDKLLKSIDPYIPLIGIFWYIGVCLLACLMAVGLIRLNRLKKDQTQTPEALLLACFERLQAQMGIKRRVQFLLSAKVTEPITFHWIKPVVLFPISMLSGLSQEQIEILLLHELAHIRRYDYLLNLIQSFLEIVLFYHPAVWWLSAKIREEREHCCDDLVLGLRNQPATYAQALTQMLALRSIPQKHFAMSASGKKSRFSKRIFRLFGKYDQSRLTFRSSLLALLLLCGFLFQSFFISVPTPPSEGMEDAEVVGLVQKNSDLMVQTEGLSHQASTKMLTSSPKEGVQTLLTKQHERHDMLVNPIEKREAQVQERMAARLIKAIHDGDKWLLGLLIDQGADVNAVKEDGRSPLIEAAHYAEVDIATLLLNKGTKVNHAANDGYTALLEAADHGPVQMVKLLLDHGANINHVSKNGHTAMMEAAENGQYEIAAYLLEKGADATFTSTSGWDALREAEEHGYENIAKLIRTHLGLAEPAKVLSTSTNRPEPGHHVPGKARISIDWSNKVNRQHVYAHLLRYKDPSYIASFYRLNLNCFDKNNKGGPRQIVKDKGRKNTLIFSLDYGDGIVYDTLQNCVNPGKDGSGKGIGKGKDRRKDKNRETTTPKGVDPYSKPIGSLGAGVGNLIQAPIYKDLSILLDLPRNAHVQIELLDLNEEPVAAVLNKNLEQGSHTIKWDTSVLEKSTYWLLIEVDGKALKQRIGENCAIRWARTSDPRPDW